MYKKFSFSFWISKVLTGHRENLCMLTWQNSYWLCDFAVLRIAVESWQIHWHFGWRAGSVCILTISHHVVDFGCQEMAVHLKQRNSYSSYRILVAFLTLAVLEYASEMTKAIEKPVTIDMWGHSRSVSLQFSIGKTVFGAKLQSVLQAVLLATVSITKTALRLISIRNVHTYSLYVACSTTAFKNNADMFVGLS